jgi:hypothetical protein
VARETKRPSRLEHCPRLGGVATDAHEFQRAPHNVRCRQAVEVHALRDVQQLDRYQPSLGVVIEDAVAIEPNHPH